MAHQKSLSVKTESGFYILIRGYGEIGRHVRFGQYYYSGVFLATVEQVKNRQKIKYAPVAELADALDLGSNSERSAGSIPVGRTKNRIINPCNAVFLFTKKRFVASPLKLL